MTRHGYGMLDTDPGPLRIARVALRTQQQQQIKLLRCQPTGKQGASQSQLSTLVINQQNSQQEGKLKAVPIGQIYK